MSPSIVINILKDAFYKRLEKKTGWGRNEIKKEFEQAEIETLSEMLRLTHEQLRGK